MEKRRILVYLVAVSVIAASSAFVYMSQYSADSTKNVVETTDVKVEANKSENKVQNISDEEAINIATETMKNYMGLDASFFSDTIINRFDNSRTVEVNIDGKKYMVNKRDSESIEKALQRNDVEMAKSFAENDSKTRPNIISILFRPKTLNDKFTTNTVDINADTKEILEVDAMNQLEEFKGRPDKNKVRETTINFFNKIGKKIDENSISIRKDIDYEFGRMFVDLKLSDGKTVSVVIDLKNYSVAGYTVESEMRPDDFVAK
ncbi:hypothetical protein NNC19_00840 [Clostridium sp. SHJSY1]|uniref:hypothetical protein n=1 Tax=Clostridium sp. SHJSY1 TaxID=2942483 RepID=UPI002875A7D0|nr:hypothetical protein [Clostridium sp. SHJSY1]MDS0524202.1 hypothetical protein [Clostridium sp. SHJSY1]